MIFFIFIFFYIKKLYNISIFKCNFHKKINTSFNCKCCILFTLCKCDSTICENSLKCLHVVLRWVFLNHHSPLITVYADQFLKIGDESSHI